MLTLREIAHIRSDFPEKFGIPRQSGLVSELISTVVFEPEYRVFPPAAPAWRKYPHGRFRDAFAVSSESTGS